MKTKKLLCAFLCLLMIISVFAGCKKDGETVEGEDAEGTVATDSDGNAYDSNGYLKDDLPDELSYGGAEFRVYSWSNNQTIDWGSGESSTNIIEQAVHQRNMAVEERLGVTLNIQYEAGHYEAMGEFLKNLENVQAAGATPYHLVSQYTLAAGTGAAKGLYADLNSDSVRYVDAEKPWWPKYMNESASIDGKLYFASGDISVSGLEKLHCMFVNLELYSSLNIADLVDGRSIYEVVEDGDWTLETYKQMATTLSGNGEDENKTYALVVINDSTSDAFLYSGGYTMIDNSSSKLKVSEDLTKNAFYDWFDEIQKILYKSDTATVDTTPKMASEKWLFYADIVDALLRSDMRDVEFDFSIIPMFKRDAEQKDYMTTGNFWVSMFSIPAASDNLEMSGAVMEGLASQSYRSVTDKAYEEGLKYRYSHFAEDAKMLDIITDNVIYETGRLFGDKLGNKPKMYAAWRYALKDTGASWSSYYGGQIKGWNSTIDTLISDINK